MSFLPSSPLSSPSSSPSLGPIDSSPPSSPNLAPLGSSPISPGPSHPYAASTKAIKPPPLYEKRGTKRPRLNSRWGAEIDSDEEDKEFYLDDASPRSSRTSGSYKTNDNARTRSIVDPLAGSAKREWVPPVREKKARIHSRTESTASTVTDVFFAPPDAGPLQDAFVHKPPHLLSSGNFEKQDTDDDVLQESSSKARGTRRSGMTLAQERQWWGNAIDNAWNNADGIIDLRQEWPLCSIVVLTPMQQRFWRSGSGAHAYTV